MMTLKYLKLWRWKLNCRLWREVRTIQGKWKSSLIQRKNLQRDKKPERMANVKFKYFKSNHFNQFLHLKNGMQQQDIQIHKGAYLSKLFLTLLQTVYLRTSIICKIILFLFSISSLLLVFTCLMLSLDKFQQMEIYSTIESTQGSLVSDINMGFMYQIKIHHIVSLAIY